MFIGYSLGIRIEHENKERRHNKTLWVFGHCDYVILFMVCDSVHGCLSTRNTGPNLERIDDNDDIEVQLVFIHEIGIVYNYTLLFISF